MPASAPGFWRHRGVIAWSLFPLSLLFGGLAALRRVLFRWRILQRVVLPVPVVVVGNVAVGGSGKTPVTLWLADVLRQRGYHPGILSRGYGGQVEGVAEVPPDGDPIRYGDEPVLMAARSGCPVFVGRDRPAAGQALLAAHPSVNVLLADDGLQHYRLARNLEIVVVDEATLGNRLLLPAGPLREGLARLGKGSFIFAHGALSAPVRAAAHGVPIFEFDLRGDLFERIGTRQERCSAEVFKGRRVHALAGIGRPERFFAQLEAMGLMIERRPFPDHHAFCEADLYIPDGDVLLMTEKDAVKCAAFAPADTWVWPVRAHFAPEAAELIVEKLDGPPTA
ncbi:tetraacyldisaccharide 4'-kinase [Zoogloea sp.]|uniref:tetraacyldisaccharide 4'-kinase n=1 Tax=Zoogloea sp. TaxID=49181 RepID=UPI00262A1B3D|nr:tetraacyldisaccharide 4'-kinase [Zoogloea sp.]MDD3354581.1 tetraacyldisaccharide 4'-kinase [Zoogloea sp.]